jgi:hypothetical protein
LQHCPVCGGPGPGASSARPPRERS